MASGQRVPLTEAQRKIVDAVQEAHPETEHDLELLCETLHAMCKWGRSCMCAHGRLWEQDPDESSGVPAYLDALPRDDPRRLAYEAHVRRKIS